MKITDFLRCSLFTWKRLRGGLADRGDAEVVDDIQGQEALGRDAVGERVAVGWEGQPRVVRLTQGKVLRGRWGFG